ncbi:MAG: hypothetical protein Ta2B_21250 [Termitinemataceae bacterium]|nr:MAG: hypothetical protein Ta2B_21250 [Termitinemataceae bacterium]
MKKLLKKIARRLKNVRFVGRIVRIMIAMIRLPNLHDDFYRYKTQTDDFLNQIQLQHLDGEQIERLVVLISQMQSSMLAFRKKLT